MSQFGKLNNSQVIPIPIVENSCKHTCCDREFLPLELAYARSIHKFQGLTAGPVDKGKIKPVHDCIVCDPGTRQFEGNNPGLFYTAVSRPTTLGSKDDGLGSALYFRGENMNAERIRDLKLDSRGVPYNKIMLRDQWVERLENNVVKSNMNNNKKATLLQWMQKPLKKNALASAIERYSNFLRK